MTVELREEVAAALAESDWESLTPIHHAVFLQLADTAIALIQSRSSVQPGVDGLLREAAAILADISPVPGRLTPTEGRCRFCGASGWEPQHDGDCIVTRLREAALASTPSNPSGWQERPMPEYTVENGKIVLPEGAPYDGKPVLIKLAVGWVEAWWDAGKSYEDHEGNKEFEGWDWVCADDTFKAEFDEPKAFALLPESPPIPATEGEGS